MNRRRFLLSALAAPAVVTTAGLLMPVRLIVTAPDLGEYMFSSFLKVGDGPWTRVRRRMILPAQKVNALTRGYGESLLSLVLPHVGSGDLVSVYGASLTEIAGVRSRIAPDAG